MYVNLDNQEMALLMSAPLTCTFSSVLLQPDLMLLNKIVIYQMQMSWIFYDKNSNVNNTVFQSLRMTALILVSLLTLPFSTLGFDTDRLEHNGIAVNFNTEECELEILYLDIQFICHRKDRPAFFIGRGEFDAVYYTGNYEINDTVTEWVRISLEWVIKD